MAETLATIRRFDTSRCRRPLMVALVLNLIMIASTCAAAATDGERRLSIRILPSVTLQGSRTQITLSQIASLGGPEELVASARQLVVADKISSPGQFAIRSWQIGERLAGEGYDLTNVEVTGSARCRVTLIGPAGIDKGADMTVFGPQLPRKNAVPRTLDAKLRMMIHEHLKDLPRSSDIKITFDPSSKSVLKLSGPLYDFRITPRKGDRIWIGEVSFRVELFKNGQGRQKVTVRARIDVRAPLIVARRTINSKARVGAEDLELAWRTIDRGQIKNGYITARSAIVGQRAKQIVPSGTALTGNMLEQMPMVNRGHLVRVICTGRGFQIQLAGKAMKTGCKDQVIPVRNESSGQMFQARVIGSGLVCVEIPAMPDKKTRLARASLGEGLGL